LPHERSIDKILADRSIDRPISTRCRPILRSISIGQFTIPVGGGVRWSVRDFSGCNRCLALDESIDRSIGQGKRSIDKSIRSNIALRKKSRRFNVVMNTEMRGSANEAQTVDLSRRCRTWSKSNEKDVVDARAVLQKPLTDKATE